MNYRDIGLVALFLVAWVVLNRWVLPSFGIPTCMSGGCQQGTCCPVAPDRMSPDGDHRETTPSSGTVGEAGR